MKNDGKLINRQSRKVVVVVAYRVWSFSRGSNCKALTGKNLVFWISGRLWEMVASRGGRTLRLDSIFIYRVKFLCFNERLFGLKKAKPFGVDQTTCLRNIAVPKESSNDDSG